MALLPTAVEGDAGSIETFARDEPARTDARVTRQPDWLNMLHRRVGTTEDAPVLDLLARLDRLAEETQRQELTAELLLSVLEPILPLLGTRYIGEQLRLSTDWENLFLEQREPLLAWLRSELDVVTLVPSPGAAYQSEFMIPVEVHHTVHPRENDTIVRTVRPGLLWHERVLCRAEVIRNELGGLL